MRGADRSSLGSSPGCSGLSLPGGSNSFAPANSISGNFAPMTSDSFASFIPGNRTSIQSFVPDAHGSFAPGSGPGNADEIFPADSSFEKLVHRLAQEHDRALGLLLLEIQKLRADLRIGGAQDPPRHVSIRPPTDAPPGWNQRPVSALSRAMSLKAPVVKVESARVSRNPSMRSNFEVEDNIVGRALSEKAIARVSSMRSEKKASGIDGMCVHSLPGSSQVVPSAQEEPERSQQEETLTSAVPALNDSKSQGPSSSALKPDTTKRTSLESTGSRSSIKSKPFSNVLSVESARIRGTSKRVSYSSSMVLIEPPDIESCQTSMREVSTLGSNDDGLLDMQGFTLTSVWTEEKNPGNRLFKMAKTIDFTEMEHARSNPPDGSSSTRAHTSSRGPSVSHALSFGGMISDSVGSMQSLIPSAFIKNRSNTLVQSGSNFRLCWDLAGMLMILWDLVWMPLQTFEPQETAATKTMMWITILFWTFDMFASFFTSYSEDGITVVQISKIAVHYLRTWFLIDFSIVATDWITAVMDSRASALGSSLTVLRMLRMLRLARVFKCRRILDEVKNHINSEYTSIVASIIRLVFMLLIANHLIACCWHYIGNATRQDDLPNWISGGSFDKNDWAYVYTTSMHWSLTQFTPASMDVQPENIYERSFTICIIVIALICFSSFVSSITNSITMLRMIREDNDRQFWLLRKFFQDGKVPRPLATRIIRYLEYATAMRKRTVQESQIKILSLLSDQLHRELKCATRVPHVQHHPLYAYINNVSNVTMHRLASKAFERISLASHDPLFFAGEEGTSMCFLIGGEMQYLRGAIPKWIERGEWMCESALWTMWVHPGEMISMTESEVISVDCREFGATVHANPAVWMNVRAYAEMYVESLNEMDPRNLSDLKFLDLSFEEKVLEHLSLPEKNEQNGASAASFIGRLLTATLWTQNQLFAPKVQSQKGSLASAIPSNKELSNAVPVSAADMMKAKEVTEIPVVLR